MMQALRIKDLLRCFLGILLKFVILTIVIGLPFYWFMVQLAEHGWK